jgi:predicted nucleic acid-binding protein
VIVVADSSPLHYLIIIEQIELLPRLYGKMAVPPAVVAELRAIEAPVAVRRWMADLPPWLQTIAPLSVPEALKFLGAGEREAIALAGHLKADALLVDDREARRQAEARNLATIGTLAVLLDAAERGWIDLESVVARLRQSSFRASPQLLKAILDRYYGIG